MKIKKIECPSCGFAFKPSGLDSICECPACKTALYLDDEKQNPSVVNININNNINNYGIDSDYNSFVRKTPPSAARVIGSVVFALVMTSFFIFSTFMSRFETSVSIGGISSSYRTVPESEPFVGFVETLYGKVASEISEEEYGRIKYLYIERNCPPSDWTNSDKYPWRFDYAFSVDADGNPVDAASVFIDSDENVQERDLQVFTNIVSANFGEYGQFAWDSDYYGDPNYKNLKKLKYYKGDNLRALVHAFADPSYIERLDVDSISIDSDGTGDLSAFSGLKSLRLDFVSERDDLEKLTAFKNLEELSVDYFDNEKRNNLDFLTSFTKLKSLKLHFGSDTDLSSMDVFYGMPTIEELDFDNIKGMKSINFVKNMPKLHSLSIRHCSIMDLEPLRDNVTMTELKLDYLPSLTDVSSLSTMINLEELMISDIGVGSADEMPSLSNLSMLKKLSIDNHYLGAVYGLSGVEELRVFGSWYLNSGVLQSLTGVRKLTISLSENSSEVMWAIAGLPNLEELVLSFSSFDSHGLEPILTAGTIRSFEILDSSIYYKKVVIDFNSLADNTTLKKLALNDLTVLDSNSYEDKKLGDYANEFFSHFTALEELHVQSNQVKDLSFVSYLPNLKILDINDNYVTDVTPLLQCEQLEVLFCEDNPISNLNILPDSVHIVGQ